MKEEIETMTSQGQMRVPSLIRKTLVVAAAGLGLIGAFIAEPAGARDSDGSGPEARGRFVAGISDLPLMEGLTARPEAGFVFDKPDGRIIEAVAAGRVSAPGVADFYRQVLSQLGWRRDAGAGGRAADGAPSADGPGYREHLYFVREGERLEVSIADREGRVTVRFSLVPRL